MSANEQPTRPMAKGPLIAASLGAAALAALIVLVAILPAEFHQDPTGLGKLTGLSRLWAPDDQEVSLNSVNTENQALYQRLQEEVMVSAKKAVTKIAIQ